MIPRREELVETPPGSARTSTSTDTSTSSPRSSVDAYLHQHDFLASPVRSPASEGSEWGEDGGGGVGGGGGSVKRKMSARLRHALGIVLLLATVFLWTASNFLASTIFADSSYSKPYFVTYINTAFFLLPLIPMLAHAAWADGRRNPRSSSSSPKHAQPLAVRLHALLHRRAGRWSLLREHEGRSGASSSSSGAAAHKHETDAELLLGDSAATGSRHTHHSSSSSNLDSSDSDDEGLTLLATGKLALEFCILWFLANYFAAACLEYTTVASSTILASTSSIWTLGLGALLRVERLTLRKSIGVLASLAGVALISTIDVSGAADADRGSFPHKSPRELAVGDVMAFVSAALYGFYAVFMKARIGSESRVNMPLFFGLVGAANVLLLWPGLVVLHFTSIEPFALPPTRSILLIVLVNSASSLVSDFCWAYAMLLTSPLVVTVGLSLTIPLSLVGQMVLDAQYASALYWVGAGVMVVSFLFVNHEEKKEVGALGEGGVGRGGKKGGAGEDGRGVFRELRERREGDV